MMGIQSSNAIGWTLMQAGLSPISLDTEMFQIVWDGENYTVHTDRLPDIFIEKVVPLDYFEYKKKDWIIWLAMDRVNIRRTPVVVFRGETDDVVTFRINLSPESAESFAKRLSNCFVVIEQAIEAFGHACEMLVQYFGNVRVEDNNKEETD